MRIEPVQDNEDLRTTASDGLLLLLLSLCISVIFYHPYYFGDELFSFAFGMGHDGRFFEIFADLNSYKPRVLMNLFWAMVVSLDFPRWVPMLVNGSAIAVCAWSVYLIGTRKLGASRLASLVGALLVVFSRFNLMLYYDYVSGTVETLSLAFFLGGALLCADSVLGGVKMSAEKAIGGGFLFLAALLVHERYLAGIAGMLVFNMLARIIWGEGKRSWRDLWIPLGMLFVLTASVFLLVTGLSDNPINMGTSGKTVSVGMETVTVAATYLLNVFFSTNYGPDWFVGLLNQGHSWGKRVFFAMSVLFTLAWLLPWFFQGRDCIAANVNKSSRYIRAASLCGFIIGMVAVASLPGADRQEARWMFPVMAILVLLILATYVGRGRNVLLTLLVFVQAFYMSFGSLDRIASINASKAARQLGYAMDAVDLPGDAGIMISVPEPDTSWVLGGADGSVFCHVNLSKKNCLFSQSAIADGARLRYGFGLSPNGINHRGDWAYRFMEKGEVDFITAKRELPEGGKLLGERSNWKDWKIALPEQIQAEGLILSAVAENFIRIKVDELDSRILVYEASALEGEHVPMRLQVNWHDAEDSFLGAFIEVVQVSGATHDYPAYLSAPDGAAYGYVYATLHESGKGKVLLKQIRLVSP